MFGPLKEDEVAGFVEKGFVILRNGFDRGDADEVRAFLWRLIRPQQTDPTTWTEPVVHIEDSFGEGPFSQVYTSRVRGAIDQLLGAGRWRFSDEPSSADEVGWFAIAFPGFDQLPYELPGLTEWHMDIR